MQFPTTIQQFVAAKSSRGGRLGRAPAAVSTMTQYGYSTPGTNINVSPTFSNIGSPTIGVAGRDLYAGGDGGYGGDFGDYGGGYGGDFGDYGDGFGDYGGGGSSSAGTVGSASSAGSQSGKTTRKAEPVGTTLSTSASIQEAIKKAAKKGQSKNPRVTRSEIKEILKESDKPRAIRNAIERGKVPVGDATVDYLNKQLKKEGARKLTPVQTKSDAPKKNKPQAQEPMGVGGLFNKSGQPGTTNMKPTAQPKPQNKNQPKKEAPKAEAKKKSQSKSKQDKNKNKNKKKK